MFQTLLGAWPISPERLEEYLTKALREGKRTVLLALTFTGAPLRGSPGG